MWALWVNTRSWSIFPGHNFSYVWLCTAPAGKKLTEQQWRDYRACYCGLCHTLNERYGFLAQFLLNYDFTLLALLLQREEQSPLRQLPPLPFRSHTRTKRSAVPPVHGRCCGYLRVAGLLETAGSAG